MINYSYKLLLTIKLMFLSLDASRNKTSYEFAAEVEADQLLGTFWFPE